MQKVQSEIQFNFEKLIKSLFHKFVTYYLCSQNKYLPLAVE